MVHTATAFAKANYRRATLAWLADYRYGDNVAAYVPKDVIDRSRRNDPEFAGVFSTDFVSRLGDRAIGGFGPGRYPDADPGMPPPV